MIQKQMKDLAWNTFKQTGNIDTFMEFKQVESMQANGNIQPTQEIPEIQINKMTK